MKPAAHQTVEPTCGEPQVGFLVKENHQPGWWF